MIVARLDDCCPTKLPRLKMFVSTPEGIEQARDMIFEMCAREGMAIQTAMSLIDSDLTEHQE